MITKKIRRSIFLLSCFLAINSASAQDWPQYLGPNRNSMSPQKGILRSWPQNGPEVLWTVDVGTPSLGPVGYVSPSVLKVGGENHVVMITASAGRGESAKGGKVVGIDPLTGKILWEYTNWQCGIPVPGVIDAGAGRAMITGGYQAGAAMIKVEKKPDGSYGVTELYKNPDFGTHTQPPVLYKDHFYAQYSTNERKDGLVCMSIDGQIKWKTMRAPLSAHLIYSFNPKVVKNH